MGAPLVGPDTRPEAKFGGIRPIGAAFVDPKDTLEIYETWFQHWQAAVREAKVIIQIQSAAYRASNPCKQEVAKINEAIKKRAGTLKLIIITTDVWEKQIQICSASLE